MATARAAIILRGHRSRGQVIGMGRTAHVIKIGDKAIKILHAFDTTGLSQEVQQDLEILEDQSRSALENEKQILPILGHYKGIVEWTNISDAGIEMKYMKNGDLQKYMKEHRADRSLQYQWIQQITSAISYVHSRGIVIVDIAARNLLVSDDLSLVLCDFGEARILGSDNNSKAVKYRKLYIKFDIAALGSLIYEIVTNIQHVFLASQIDDADEVGSDIEQEDRCNNVTLETDGIMNYSARTADSSNEVDREGEDAFDDDDGDNEVDRDGEDDFEDNESIASLPSENVRATGWPCLQDLPNVEKVPFGEVICKCWDKDGFQTMSEVCEAIITVSL